MSVKGMLWALGVAGAAALAVAWVADRLPASQVASAIGIAAQSAPAAPAAARAGGGPPAPAVLPLLHEPAPPPENGMAGDAELPGREEAVAPADRGGHLPAAPTREDRPEAAPSLAVTALCAPAGSRCGSSADCCPGLACAGGMAGYGTPGRCE